MNYMFSNGMQRKTSSVVSAWWQLFSIQSTVSLIDKSNPLYHSFSLM